MSDIRGMLNPSQYRAVTTTDGPVLVIAGAGSGKTRVIEYRVLHLVQQGVDPGAILLLTFTRKAAQQMISRASRHDPRCKNVEGGTFHSFAYKILRRYAKAVDFPESFFILDESDAEEAIHRCATRLGFYEREKRFPKKDTLRTIISMSINKDASIGEIITKEYPHFKDIAGDIERLRGAYAEFKVAKNYLDYDDLLVCLRIMLENGEIRERISQKYRYVMVDEYQDTNRIQGDIACFLAAGHNNIMVVGDDAQSIYGFRGASHENIMRFPDRFPGCVVITLEENYRSTQPVLDIANRVLEDMKHKYSKCLVAARQHEGMRPQLLFFRDAHEEASWVAEMIKRQMDEGVALHHQCVLFRSMYLSIPLQSELSRRNIPYETFGGLKFYETAHVRDLMAHIKATANPKDELAWNRILMLIERIGPKTAERITDEVMRCASLDDILRHVFEVHSRNQPYAKGIRRLRDSIVASSGAAQDVGERFSLFLDYYLPLLKDRFDDWHLRLNDLDALRQIAGRYDTIEELIEDFAVEPPERGVWRVEPETKEEERPLVLSTIHSAKGLEWDIVFIMGIVDGVLPITFSLDDEDEIEEERRLFYVAITRAKRRLLLTLHHEGNRGGITQFNKLSRFVDTARVMEKLDVRDATRYAPRQAAGHEEEGVTTVYDKKTLLGKILGSYK